MDPRTITPALPARVCFAAFFAVLLAAAGCGGSAPVQPIPAGDPCITVDDAARPRITVAVRDSAGPLTPPVTAAARLVFAQLYHTLVEVDCTGRVVPGLASEWSSDDGRTWLFRIAPGFTFSDGTHVNARSIMDAWSAARLPSLAGVTVLGEHQLRVTMHEPAAVRDFATPMLAAVRTAPGTWPAGTGPYTVAAASPGGVLRLLARIPDAHSPDTIDVRTFARDPRTALDAGVDALVTGDAATLAYARARSDYTATPLPWTRTYVIAVPVTPDDTAQAASAGLPDADDLANLARDAVHADARPAQPPFWWQDCTPSIPPRSRAGGMRGEILYPSEDAAARAIAERVAALAWPLERTPGWLRDLMGEYAAPPRTRGASDGEMADAVRTRSTIAIVTSLPRVPAAACTHMQPDPRGGALAAIPDGWRVTPLLDTREYLIHRTGTGRIVVDGSGMIRFGRRPR